MRVKLWWLGLAVAFVAVEAAIWLMPTSYVRPVAIAGVFAVSGGIVWTGWGTLDDLGIAGLAAATGVLASLAG